MTNLAPFLHKFSVSWIDTRPQKRQHGSFEAISILNADLTGNRLDANVGGKYLKKASPNPTKLAYFGAKI